MEQRSLVKLAANDEQLLKIALCVSAKYFSDNDSPVRAISDRIIIAYIIQRNGNPDMPDDDITEEYASLLTEYVLSEGVEKGEIEVLFDEDGEIRYRLKETGM